MSWQEIYEKWIGCKNLDLNIKKQLLNKDEIYLADCFYQNLRFGTAGIRGEMGPGPNRLNIYTIRKASAGLAAYIKKKGKDAMKRGVVIAYDSRYQSYSFAKETARVLVQIGIKTYLFDALRTTPQLSFAVRYLQAESGIVITASHNPKEYNGFKVYNSDGCQISPSIAKAIQAHIEAIENELTIPVSSKGELSCSPHFFEIGKQIDQAYLQQVTQLSLQNSKKDAAQYKIVYTPLHGTGKVPVTKVLYLAGFKNVQVVPEQASPDPEFSTVVYPNPEDQAAFSMAIRAGYKFGAELLLATDPDADRLGVAVLNQSGFFELLTGNQIGAIILHYLIEQKKRNGTLSSQAVMLKSIVTSEFGKAIASAHGIKTIDTLTGFKYIGEKIKAFEQHKAYDFLFGYEESYGYLIGDFVRDKDAVQTALLIAEIGCYYRAKGLYILEVLEQLYQRYGYYQEHQESITFQGKAGVLKINQLMENFRQQAIELIAGQRITVIEDYQSGKRKLLAEERQERIQLPQENVLKFICEDESWLAIRPSGTEPKIKFYIGAKGRTATEVQTKVKAIRKELDSWLKEMN